MTDAAEIVFLDSPEMPRGFYVGNEREALRAGPYPTCREAEYAAIAGPPGATWRPVERRPRPAPRRATGRQKERTR